MVRLARTRAARRPTKADVAAKANAARARAKRPVRRAPTQEKPSTLTSATTAVKGAAAGMAAAVTRHLPGASGIDAITLLENDHRRLEHLLKDGEQTTPRTVKKRAALLATITTELAVHELIEEKILYPALEAHPQARDIVLEGFQEHHVADLILKELHELARNDERWQAKFKVLKENVEHHIQEEEGPMFRTARGVMTREELKILGARMAQMKADAERGILPD
jgi:hemerythrin superfamily protein